MDRLGAAAEALAGTIRFYMRIICISDTHGRHGDLVIPDGDFLIHAGDFTNYGNAPEPYLKFDEWLGSLPHPYKIIVPGNHEFLLEEPRMRGIIKNASLLIDAGVMVAGLRVWGSPVTPLYGAAFGMSHSNDRRRHWAKMPDDTDILITHGPPFGILDHVTGTQRKEGDLELLEAVLRINPPLHIFGHAHSYHGQIEMGSTLFVNAALPYGGVLKPPIVTELPRNFKVHNRKV